MPSASMKVLEVPGGRLAYWELGSGSPVVFVHGVATTGELWAGDLEPLAGGCRLVVYDRRGYGHSSESPRSWQAHCEDAAALMEGLDARPAVLVGYSAGASIALELTLNRPELVAALVLVDPAFNLRRAITPGLLKTLLEVRLLRRLGMERRAAERWLRFVASYSTGGTAFDKASPERRATLLANAPGMFADSDAGLPSVDEARLADIKVPVTLIEAKLSPPFLRRSCARLRALLPRAEVFAIETAGHHITIDARDELVSILGSRIVGSRLDPSRSARARPENA